MIGLFETGGLTTGLEDFARVDDLGGGDGLVAGVGNGLGAGAGLATSTSLDASTGLVASAGFVFYFLLFSMTDLIRSAVYFCLSSTSFFF